MPQALANKMRVSVCLCVSVCVLCAAQNRRNAASKCKEPPRRKQPSRCKEPSWLRTTEAQKPRRLEPTKRFLLYLCCLCLLSVVFVLSVYVLCFFSATNNIVENTPCLRTKWLGFLMQLKLSVISVCYAVCLCIVQKADSRCPDSEVLKMKF